MTSNLSRKYNVIEYLEVEILLTQAYNAERLSRHLLIFALSNSNFTFSPATHRGALQTRARKEVNKALVLKILKSVTDSFVNVDQN